ncbi:MAG: (d)CMP kinase [Saprospiraceae bacterium]|nr:(d)CMP kinase [Saprospiraceae bacterium]
MTHLLTIAIDGHSSCGKSTLARDLAHALGYTYIDSGAMYRAVTLYFLRHNISLEDEKAILNALENLEIELTRDNQVFLNNENVTLDIRKAEVSEMVSQVATISSVRSLLVALQQSYKKSGGIVMDGRDIGTVVFPDADVKIFLTADLNVRANRRHEELLQRNIPMTRSKVIENLKYRDHIDSTREDSPLVKAEDAILIDNSDMDREQQLNYVLGLVKDHLDAK